MVMFSSVDSLAQGNDRYDSLEAVLGATSDDSEKIDILNELSFAYIFLKPEKAPEYNHRALLLAQETNYIDGEADAYDVRGILYRRSGFYEEATVDHLRSLRMHEKTHDVEGMAINFANMGMVYLDQQDYKQALPFIKRSLAMKMIHDDTVGIIFSYNDLVSAYIGNRYYDSALYYCRRAKELSNQIGEEGLLAQVQFSIATIHYHKRNHKLAEFELLKMIEEGMADKNLYILGKAYKLLSDIYRVNKDYEKSIEYGKLSYHTAKKYDLSADINEALLALSRSYELSKDYESAFKYQKMYVSYRDSVYSSESEQRTILLASKYEFEAQQNLMQTRHDTELAQQRLVIALIISLLVGMIAFFFLTIKKNNSLKLANQSLERANADIELKKEEIEQQKEKIHMQADKLIHVNSSKDQVFNIISHDLKSPIESLNGLLDLVSSGELNQSDFTSLSAHLQEKVSALSYTLNNLLIWSRSQMKGLTSNPKEINLCKIIENKLRLFSQMARNKDIQLNSVCGKNQLALADEDQIRMVLRNLINNAIKFTKQGGRIDIIVEDHLDEVRLAIKDNGIGISLEDQKKLFSSSKHFTNYGTSGEKGTGIGLLLCKEIIDKNGGKLEIESTEGEGSTFSFSLPKLFTDPEISPQHTQQEENLGQE